MADLPFIRERSAAAFFLSTLRRMDGREAPVGKRRRLSKKRRISMRLLVFGLAAVVIGSGPAEAAWKQYKYNELGIFKDFPAEPVRSTATYKAPLAKEAQATVLTALDEGITYKLTVVDFSSRATEGANLVLEAAERESGGLRGTFTVTDFPLWDHGANTVAGVEMLIEKDGIHTVEDIVFHKGKLYLIAASVPNDSPGRHSLGLARFMDTSQFYLKGYGFNYATGHDYPLGDDDPLDRDDRPAAPGYVPPPGAVSGPNIEGGTPPPSQ
jgi:hypothetical protein